MFSCTQPSLQKSLNSNHFDWHAKAKTGTRTSSLARDLIYVLPGQSLYTNALYVDKFAECRSRRAGAIGRTMSAPLVQSIPTKQTKPHTAHTLVRNVSLTRHRSYISDSIFYGIFELRANCMPFWKSKQAAVSVQTSSRAHPPFQLT
jgi:hypothetical protein